MSETASVFAAIETLTQASAPRGLFNWVATVDHKRIGILYLLTALVFLPRAASRRCSYAFNSPGQIIRFFRPMLSTRSSPCTGPP